MSVTREIAFRGGGEPQRHSLGMLGEHVLLESGVSAQAVAEGLKTHTHPAAAGDAAGFLSAGDKQKLDGIAPGANNYVHPATAGMKHLPAGGTAGQVLRYSAPGTAEWEDEGKREYGVFTRGEAGLAPPPGGLGASRFLREDGAWAAPPDNNTTYAVFTRDTPGLVPAAGDSATTTRYLREDGTWAVPPDTDTTYSAATPQKSGLLSAPDKAKLSALPDGATNYVHPDAHPAGMLRLSDGRSVEQALLAQGVLTPDSSFHPFTPTSDYGAEFRGSLYRENPDGTVTVLTEVKVEDFMSGASITGYFTVGGLPFPAARVRMGERLTGWSVEYTAPGDPLYPFTVYGKPELEIKTLYSYGALDELVSMSIPAQMIENGSAFTRILITYPYRSPAAETGGAL